MKTVGANNHEPRVGKSASSRKPLKTAQKGRSATKTLPSAKNDSARHATRVASKSCQQGRDYQAVPAIKRPQKRHFSDFEDYRAQLLHELFLTVAACEEKGVAALRTFNHLKPEISRTKFRGKRIRLSLQRFYRLLQDWRERPYPSTLRRKYVSGPSIRKPGSEKVIQSAIAQRLPVKEAMARMAKPPCSARTVFRHFQKEAKLLTQLVRLNQKEKKLAAQLAGLPQKS